MFRASIRFLVDDSDRAAAAPPGICLFDDEVSTVKRQHPALFGCVALEIYDRGDDQLVAVPRGGRYLFLRLAVAGHHVLAFGPIEFVDERRCLTGARDRHRGGVLLHRELGPEAWLEAATAAASLSRCRRRRGRIHDPFPR